MKQHLQIILIVLLMPCLLFSQHEKEEGGHVCGNIETAGTYASRSATCDVNISSLPIKTIRITIHVFGKDDGSENIPDNSTGDSYIRSIVSHANDRLGSMVAMNLSSPSPLITDTKIRYDLKNIYFWEDSAMWSKGNNTFASGDSLYDFVQAQSIAYKSNSIHILYPEIMVQMAMEARVSHLALAIKSIPIWRMYSTTIMQAPRIIGTLPIL